MMKALYWLLWSNKHGQWWKTDGRGYTSDIAEAGAYTEEEATREVQQSAYHMNLAMVTCMVVAPPDWNPKPEPLPRMCAILAKGTHSECHRDFGHKGLHRGFAVGYMECVYWDSSGLPFMKVDPNVE